MAAFPTLLSVTQTLRATNGLSHVVALPATVDAGDLLLVVMAFDGQPTLTWDNTTAGAWSLLHDTKSGTAATLAAYWKVADGTEDGKSLTIGLSATEQSVAQVFRFSGAVSIECGVAVTIATGTASDPPALAPSWLASDTYWIAASGINNGVTVSVDPVGYSASTTVSSSASAGSEVTLTYATRSANVLSENPSAFTISAVQSRISQTYAVSPSVREGVGASHGTTDAAAPDGTVYPPPATSHGTSSAVAVGAIANKQRGGSSGHSSAVASTASIQGKAARSFGGSRAAAVGMATARGAGIASSLGNATAARQVVAYGAGVSSSYGITGIVTSQTVEGTGTSRSGSSSSVVSTAYHLRAPTIQGRSGVHAEWTVDNKQMAVSRGFGGTSVQSSAVIEGVGFSLGQGRALGNAVQYDPPRPGFLFANNAISYLSDNLAHNGTVARIPPGTAGMFPVPGTNERFVAFLQDGKQDPEVVYVTANPLTGLMAIERGKEGTAGTTWQAGTLFIHSISKDSLEWVATGGAAGIVLDNFNTELQTQAAAIAALKLVVRDLELTGGEERNWLRLQIEQAQAAIVQQGQVYADLNFAFSQLRTEVQATLASNSATIISIMETTANSYEALAEFRTEILAELNGSSGSVVLEAEARAAADEALALQLTALTAVVDDNTAQIENLFTVTATNYESLASLITDLTATVGDNTAAITLESEARATQYEALATQISLLEAGSGDGSAAIALEAEARANADAAFAAQLLTVSAQVDDNTSTVTILAAAQADLIGNLSSFYSVELDADGVFAGFRLTAGTNANGTTVSEMKVQVGNFTIYNNTDAPVFAVSGGVTLIQNVVAGWAVIESAVVNNFVAGSANIGEAVIGEVHIQNASIVGAHIKNLEVDTIKIKNAAVSNYAVAYTAGAVTVTNGLPTELQAVAYTSEGGRMHLRVGAFLFQVSGPTTTGNLQITRKNTVTNVETKIFDAEMFIRGFNGNANVIFGSPFYEWIDYPPAGSYIYKLWIEMSGLAGFDYNVTRRMLIVEEVKK